MGSLSETGRARIVRLVSRAVRVLILAGSLLGLPLLGLAFQNKSISPYLKFPPKTRYVTHAPFSWAPFWIFVAMTAGFVVPFLLKYLKSRHFLWDKVSPERPFPWWGWFGLICGLLAWILAWTRFSWFAPAQAHTFTPLWLCFILVANGLAWRRSGRCIMVHHIRFFIFLFPLSSILWWIFEYLNQFVNNWIYIGPDYGRWEYVLNATIPFSTVLPAVLSMREWLFSAPGMQRAYYDFWAAPWALRRDVAAIIFLGAATSLALMPIWPSYLFPLLWVSPLLLGVSLETLWGEPHVFSSALGEGDWRMVVSSALAALICGWFWEMWNFYSLSKWHYSIPLVHRFEVFEMPILGYAGYLPFGVTCAFFVDLLGGFFERRGTELNVRSSKNLLE